MGGKVGFGRDWAWAGGGRRGCARESHRGVEVRFGCGVDVEVCSVQRSRGVLGNRVDEFVFHCVLWHCVVIYLFVSCGVGCGADELVSM